MNKLCLAYIPGFYLKINIQESLEKILTCHYGMVSHTPSPFQHWTDREHEVEENHARSCLFTVSCFAVFKFNIE